MEGKSSCNPGEHLPFVHVQISLGILQWSIHHLSRRSLFLKLRASFFLREKKNLEKSCNASELFLMFSWSCTHGISKEISYCIILRTMYTNLYLHSKKGLLKEDTDCAMRNSIDPSSYFGSMIQKNHTSTTIERDSSRAVV